MKLADYEIKDAQAAEALLSDEDFLSALNGSMNLLGSVFLYHPIKDERGKRALDSIRSLDIASEWPFGTDEQRKQAADLLKAGMDETDYELERRFTELFRGPGKLPAAIWGSVYLDNEQVTYGDSWVALRAWLRKNGIKSLYSEKDPEDEIGRMMALTAQIAESRPDLLCEMLGEHFLPWAYRFFDYFEPAAIEHSATYGAFAVLGRSTLQDVQNLLTLTPARYRLYR